MANRKLSFVNGAITIEPEPVMVSLATVIVHKPSSDKAYLWLFRVIGAKNRETKS